MNRLTRHAPDGAANFADADFERVCAELTPDNREKVSAALEMAAQYEDAEEQGRLLPVKIGDTVYRVDACRVYESKIKSLIYDTDGAAFDGRAIGKTVFPTRTEVETALKGGGV